MADCMVMRRLRSMVALFLVGLVIVGVSRALAQAAIEVPQGQTFTVENGNECAPDVEATATYIRADGTEAFAGVAITDPNGHFDIRAEVATTTALGAGTITVSCGLESSQLM